MKKIDIGCRYKEGLEEMKKIRMLDETTKECSIALLISSLKNHFKDKFKQKISQILEDDCLKNDTRTLYFLKDISFIKQLDQKTHGEK